MNNYNDLFARDIRWARDRHIAEATLALIDADRPADVVRGAAFLAGLQWDTDHPTLAARIGDAA